MAATDLVRYVASEIAADGPEGSSVDRLNSFINSYATQESSSSTSEQNIIDEDLRKYVIQTLCRLPNISPGRYIKVKATADKSGKAKGNNKGKGKRDASSEEEDDDDDKATPLKKINSASVDFSGDHVEAQESDKDISLEDLLSKYGDSFRLVADKDSIDAVCSGTSQGMSAAVYQLLLFVMRTRGQGAAFPEIGKKFHYTTSTIFFLVKQLCDVGLGIKFKAKYGQNQVAWIVAKQYAHLCTNLSHESLQEGQDENYGEQESMKQSGGKDSQIADATLQEMSPEAVQDLIRKSEKSKGRQEAGEEDEGEEGEEEERKEGGILEEGAGEDAESSDAMADGRDTSEMVTLHGLLAYPAIDVDKQGILLQDRTLIRMRLLKLLFASKNNATIRADLIVRIGIKEPNPGLRKIFNAILRQMEAENLVKRCMLRRPLHHDKEHKEFCWMATEEGREHLDQVSTSAQHRELKRLSAELSRELELNKSRLLLETSVNKQILDKIDQSEEEGMTIERLNMLFGGNNDRRRDLDHMLTALKKPSNAYYDDFTVFSGLEQDGRTRSQRFYTRQWRPSNLAPNETRRIDRKILDIWVKLPFETETSKASQNRGKGKMKSSQSVVDEEDKNEASQSDGSSHVHSRPRKKARPIVSDTDEVKIKGRPRKDHSEKALDRAKKYQEKKEARMKEEEEKRGVEDLLGESSAVLSKSRKVRARPSKNAVDNMDGEASIQTMERSLEDVTTQTSFDESNIPTRKHHRDSSQTINSSPIAPAAKRAASQTILGDAQRHQKLNKDVKKRPSTNLTLQLKYEALREFFVQTEIFESTAFESLYSNFLVTRFGSDFNLQPYEMDRKLRLKMLNEFEKSGFACSKKITAPISSKEKLRTIWHIRDIDEEVMIKYCREVTNGDIRRDGSRRIDGRWEKPVIKPQILLEAHEVDKVDSFLMRIGSGSVLDVANLEEIVDHQGIREIFLDYENVRSQYTGRLYGQGAQSRYLHTTVIQLLKEAGAKEYRKADWAIDLSWWTSEASFEQLLKLFTPSAKNDVIIEASQNAALAGVSVKDLPEGIQTALNISNGLQGTIDLLRPLMNLLRSFNLAHPVRVLPNEQIIESTSDEETLLYRFQSHGVIQKSQLHSDASNTFDFNDPIDIEHYWQFQQERFTSAEFEIIRREMTTEQVTMYENLFTKTSWSLHYFMLKPQKKYLQKTMSLGIQANVVNNLELLEKISKTCLTPKSIVRRWYERRFKVRSNADSHKERGEKEKKDRPVTKEKSMSTRQLNAIKKKEVKEYRNRLNTFSDIVNACLMELKIGESDRAIMMSKLKHVKRQYGRGKMVLSMKRVRNLFREVMRGHEAGDTAWKDILNRRRRPMKPVTSTEQKQVRYGNVDKEGPRSRKSTISWTRDRDELLRDAIVILRCRDRFRAKNPNIIKKNWAALDQIFPDVGAPSRSGRFELLEKAVGEEQYLQQLELEWDKVWAEHRGGELVDDYPGDPINFDLSQHIEFLRLHIDKIQVARDVDNATSDPLPLDQRLMQYYFDYDRPLPSHENAANTLARFALAEFSGEAKSKAIRSNAFTLGGQQRDDNLPLSANQERTIEIANREKGLMMGAVKMILCTEESKYSEPIATKLCTDNATEKTIDEAISEMIDLHIIRRKSKEDREIPNRNMVFTEEYDKFHQESLETLPFWDMMEDFNAIIKSGSMKMYQTMQDEETAASLMLLGLDKVDASIDFSPIENFKHDVFFNAKKLNDSNLEVPIELKLKGKRQIIKKKWTEVVDVKKIPLCEDILKWFDKGTETIESRVNSAWKDLIANLNKEDDVKVARRIQTILVEAGPVGLSKNELWENLELNGLSIMLKAAMRDAHQLPLIFITGYNEARIVSAQYIEQWTIKLNSGRRIFPYKWNDIHGNHLGKVWSICVKLIIHAIITRPGITLAQLLDQFRLIMDRSEVRRIIDNACHLQVIHKVLSTDDSIKGDQAEWKARGDYDLALIADSIIG